MKHKHSELIKRWADDDSLIVLAKNKHHPDWNELGNSVQEAPCWNHDSEYFLVCEKHVEVALRFLNGGVVMINAGGNWYATDEPSFDSQCKYKIKPKLEKVTVWVGVAIGGGSIMALDSNPINNPFKDNYTWTEVEVMKEVK
jgi:hypothetical protein